MQVLPCCGLQEEGVSQVNGQLTHGGAIACGQAGAGFHLQDGFGDHVEAVVLNGGCFAHGVYCTRTFLCWLREYSSASIYFLHKREDRGGFVMYNCVLLLKDF